jgi:hypothetical protein
MVPLASSANAGASGIIANAIAARRSRARFDLYEVFVEKLQADAVELGRDVRTSMLRSINATD